MSNNTVLSSKNSAWLHDVCFSVYASILLAWVEEHRPFPLSSQGRVLYFWHPHEIGLNLGDFVLFYAELVLIPAAAIFGLLLSVRLFSSGPTIIKAAGLVLIYVGFPFVILYRAEIGRQAWYLFSIAILVAATSLLSFLYRGLQPSSRMVGVWILPYFYIVSFLGGGVSLISERSIHWTIWDYALIAYPLLGFCYALVWGSYTEGLVRVAAQTLTPRRHY